MNACKQGDADFVETAALLAVLSDDHDEAIRLVESMLPGERWKLALASRCLASFCDGRYR